MKLFSCGDVVTGCPGEVMAATEAEIHGWAACHVMQVHHAAPTTAMHQAVAAAIRTA